MMMMIQSNILNTYGNQLLQMSVLTQDKNAIEKIGFKCKKNYGSLNKQELKTVSNSHDCKNCPNITLVLNHFV